MCLFGLFIFIIIFTHNLYIVMFCSEDWLTDQDIASLTLSVAENIKYYIFKNNKFV